jgi:hypothetical protein
MGFVNCEWAIKGALRPNNNSKIFADGQTFDGKLYTFKETDYKSSFEYLNIFVKKKADGNVANIVQSVESSDSSISVSNYSPSSRRIDRAAKLIKSRQLSPRQRNSSDSVEFAKDSFKLKKKSVQERKSNAS